VVRSLAMATSNSAIWVATGLLLLQGCGGSDATMSGNGGAAGANMAGSGGASAAGGSLSNAGTAGDGSSSGACFAERVAPTRIAMNGQTGCAIDSNGALHCWGTAAAGATLAPDGTFGEVSGRSGVYGAVGTNSAPVFWGDGTPPAGPAPSAALTRIAVNGYNACAITDCGAIVCWPTGASDKYGTSNAPSGSFRQITGGLFHECALEQSGAVQCWSDNTYGQTMAPSGSFVFVTSGSYHSCAIATDGHVECWGAKNPADAGTSGQVDFGQAVAPSGTFKDISGGELHTCAIRQDNTVACWGLGTTAADCQGQTECGQAAPPAGQFEQVSAGFTNTCGIELDGSLACWGSNSDGRSTPPTDFK
jgi:hypothetical protein